MLVMRIFVSLSGCTFASVSLCVFSCRHEHMYTYMHRVFWRNSTTFPRKDQIVCVCVRYVASLSLKMLQFCCICVLCHEKNDRMLVCVFVSVVTNRAEKHGFTLTFVLMSNHILGTRTDWNTLFGSRHVQNCRVRSVGSQEVQMLHTMIEVRSHVSF